MFGRLDNFSFQYQVAPEAPAETHVIAGSYALHLRARRFQSVVSVHQFPQRCGDRGHAGCVRHRLGIYTAII